MKQEIEVSLSNEQKKGLEQLRLKYSDVITSKLGQTQLLKQLVEVPYRLPYAKYEAVKGEVQKMEEMGIIKPSSSEWASPMVIVPKKDGTIRLCVDCRRLNKVSIESLTRIQCQGLTR